MPIFPFKGESLHIEYSRDKEVFRHATSPNYLVLERRRNDVSWLEQISARYVWTEDEKKAFLFSQFYLKKLLHTIFPDVFTDFTYIDRSHFVAEEIIGRNVSWDDLTNAEKLPMQNALRLLNIDESNIDFTGYNFIRETKNGIPTGRAVYVDDIGDDSFFTYLSDQKTSKKDDTNLDPKILASQTTKWYKDIIDKQKLLDYVNSPASNLNSTQRTRALKFWERFKEYAKTFAGLEMIDLNQLLGV